MTDGVPEGFRNYCWSRRPAPMMVRTTPWCGRSCSATIMPSPASTRVGDCRVLTAKVGRVKFLSMFPLQRMRLFFCGFLMMPLPFQGQRLPEKKEAVRTNPGASQGWRWCPGRNVFWSKGGPRIVPGRSPHSSLAFQDRARLREPLAESLGLRALYPARRRGER
jgi:hypothetical protein